GQQVQSYDGVGGTFALLMDDVIVAGRGNDGSLAASDVASRERIINFSGRQMVVTTDRAYLQSATHLLALDRKRHVALVRRSNAIKKRIDALNKRLNGRNDDATRPLREQLVELARQHDE